jgi:hypothetical protein
MCSWKAVGRRTSGSVGSNCMAERHCAVACCLVAGSSLSPPVRRIARLTPYCCSSTTTYHTHHASSHPKPTLAPSSFLQ